MKNIFIKKAEIYSFPPNSSPMSQGTVPVCHRQQFSVAKI